MSIHNTLKMLHRVADHADMTNTVGQSPSSNWTKDGGITIGLATMSSGDRWRRRSFE